MTNKKLLIGHARTNPTFEATKAEAMFKKFLSGGFSYDELSDHPDYPAYASADVWRVILPLIIDEMLARADTTNFLIYHVIAAVDPLGEGSDHVVQRNEELAGLVDNEVAEKVLTILEAVKTDPPVHVERLDRIIAFWKKRVRPSV
jgi:hypothetical protein